MQRERSLVCADGLSVGWWQREFALLRAAPASAGFGILKQPRQTRPLVTNRADMGKHMVKPTERRAAPRSACVCNGAFAHPFALPKFTGRVPKPLPKCPVLSRGSAHQRGWVQKHRSPAGSWQHRPRCRRQRAAGTVCRERWCQGCLCRCRRAGAATRGKRLREPAGSSWAETDFVLTEHFGRRSCNHSLCN